MTLYTSKVVAQWLCLTERRVRQLRDEGVIVEARPGLYELQPTVARYITYIGGAGKETLTNERMKLTRAKREAAELENELRKEKSTGQRTLSGASESMFLNIKPLSGTRPNSPPPWRPWGETRLAYLTS
ncbi:MAG: hypothetical protein ACLUEK_00670 [Oscillospiraceae bacterium]